MESVSWSTDRKQLATVRDPRQLVHDSGIWNHKIKMVYLYQLDRYQLDRIRAPAGKETG